MPLFHLGHDQRSTAFDNVNVDRFVDGLDVRAHLAAPAAELDDGQALSVPVSWVRALLDSDDGSGDVAVDLTVDEVAQMFGRSPQRIREWVRAGALDA